MDEDLHLDGSIHPRAPGTDRLGISLVMLMRGRADRGVLVQTDTRVETRVVDALGESG
jgi:hypothetical protein